MIEVQTGARLEDHADFDQIFRDWIRGCETLGEAQQELQSFFDDDRRDARAGAIWAAGSWREAWLEDFVADLPDAGAADQARRDVEDLAAGRADVIVTGQQPGFLGGGLHTFYKVATAVVLAELRTVAGRPTIPVFWCGDDDDDIREALQAVAWDPRRGVLLRHELHGQRGLPSDRMIGDLPAAEIAAGAAAWLGEVAGRNDLAGDLATLWRRAAEAGQSWGRLHRQALLRLFRNKRLLVVHGNDPLLHGAAAVIYERLWQQRGRLREAARHGARRLVAAGYEAAVTEPSIQRFLHQGRDGRRRPLAAEHQGSLPPARELRPGVVARSCVQDWLFRPAAVVVGPGEAAYLKQLDPVYAALDLPRAPMIPRLFALAGPAGHGDFRSLTLEFAERSLVRHGSEPAAAAQRVVALARHELLGVLHREARVPQERLQLLADQVLDRWSRHLTGLLQRELRRRSETVGAGHPPWLRPEGRRQERALATFAAAALWGDPFTDAVVHASRRHVDAGLDGDWCEYLLTVPGA